MQSLPDGHSDFPFGLFLLTPGKREAQESNIVTGNTADLANEDEL